MKSPGRPGRRGCGPADQRLDAGHRGLAQIDDRLVVQGPVLLLDGLAQAGRERQPGHRVGAVRRVKDACRRGRPACSGTSPYPRSSSRSWPSSASSGEHAEPDARRHVDLCPVETNGSRRASWIRTATDSATTERARLGPRPRGASARGRSTAGGTRRLRDARRGRSRASRPQTLGQLHEQLVAGLVAERVVHQLEVVEVECRSTATPASFRRATSQGQLEKFVEHRSGSAGRSSLSW